MPSHFILTTLAALLISQSGTNFFVRIEPVLSSSFLSQTDDLIAGVQPTATYISHRKSMDESMPGFVLSAGLKYPLSSRLNGEAGLSFMNLNCIQGKYCPVDRYDYGGTILNSYQVKGTSVSFYSLGLPVGLSYDLFLADRLVITPVFSFAPHVFLHTSNSDETLEGVFPDTEHKRFFLEGHAGIGFLFNLNARYALELRPGFGYALTPNLLELSAVQQNNWHAGLGLGLIFNQ